MDKFKKRTEQQLKTKIEEELEQNTSYINLVNASHENAIEAIEKLLHSFKKDKFLIFKIRKD